MSSFDVAIIMGSKSDWPLLSPAADVLDSLGVAYTVEIVSAHRTPDKMHQFAAEAEGKGIQVIIAGAGGAAHLPGMVAAQTIVPVIGVPMPTTALQGMDALMSIVQMPQGTPVATMAIGKPGAGNAGFFAAQLLARHDTALADKLKKVRADKRDFVLAHNDPRSADT